MDISTITKTFEQHMRQAIRAVHPYPNVPNNRVYRIETASQPYIFKVYSQRNWPEDGKLPFVARKLTEHNIPHARLFVFDREDERFPNGYLIEECLPGTTADRLELSGKETVTLFEKLAETVSPVHQIELTNYGYIGSGVAEWTTFSEFMYNTLKDATTGLIACGHMQAEELEAVREAIRAKLTPYDALPGVLVHGDLSAKNALVHANKMTLIDWDDAYSLCWMADIARMTLWMKLHMSPDAFGACRNAFLSRYETKHDKQAYDDVEDALHVWYGLDCLNYFINDPISEKIKAFLRSVTLR